MQWRTALLAWITLLLLLTINVAIAVFMSDSLWSLIINGISTTVMAAIILIFFMRLNDTTALLRLFSLGGFLWVGLLLFFTLMDIYTR